MDYDDPEFYTFPRRETWKNRLDELVQAGDFIALLTARRALSRYVKKSRGLEQNMALQVIDQRLPTMLRWKVLELCRHIELYPWPDKNPDITKGSVDIQRLHREVSAYRGGRAGFGKNRDKRFKDYSRQDYLELANALRTRHKYATPLDDDFEGYASDDSDNEDEEEPVIRKRTRRRRRKRSSSIGALNLASKSSSDDPFAPLKLAGLIRSLPSKRPRLPPHLRKAKQRQGTFRKLNVDASAMRARVYRGFETYDRLRNLDDPKAIERSRGQITKLPALKKKLGRLRAAKRKAIETMPLSNNPFAVLGSEEVMTLHDEVTSVESTIRTLHRNHGRRIRQWERALHRLQLDTSLTWINNDVHHTINAQIQHGDSWNQQVERDFVAARRIYGRLQTILGSSRTNAKQRNDARARAKQALGELKTQFAIAQYRGITYKTSAFDRSARQSSREKREVGDAIYSFSVFQAAGVSPPTYFAGKCSADELRRLDVTARSLKAVLIQKRNTKPVDYLNIRYDNHAHALQDVYTNNYDFFHAAIQVHFAPKTWYEEREKKAREALEKTHGWNKRPEHVRKKKIQERAYGSAAPNSGGIYEGLFNAGCPFVSTGDVPRHALKYAYGKKFYKGHEHERLQARWSKSGRALRPYSGKVYVTLHELCEYIDDDPLHVRSLNNAGRIKVGSDIALERETTFPAYIPAERLVIEHIAKIPSFVEKHGWSKTYLTKYGIDAKDYAQYYEAVRTKEVQALGEEGGSYINLDSWLVNFHEVRLVEAARRRALERGQILIYRGEDGNLSRNVPTPLSLSEKAQQAITERTLGKRRFDSGVVSLSREIARSRFDGALPKNRLTKKTNADGNCLFHALSAALADANVAVRTHQELREDIAAEYRGNVALCQQQGIDDEYIDEMEQLARHPGDVARWGSDAEIIALTKIYPHLRVRVYSPTYPAPTYRLDFEDFLSPGLTHEIHLRHEGGNHWTWLG